MLSLHLFLQNHCRRLGTPSLHLILRELNDYENFLRKGNWNFFKKEINQKSGEYFYGDFRPCFRKKEQHLLTEKRVHYSFSRKKGLFFIFKGYILCYSYTDEWSKVEPGLGLPQPTMRSNLFDFVVNFIDTNCF